MKLYGKEQGPMGVRLKTREIRLMHLFGNTTVKRETTQGLDEY